MLKFKIKKNIRMPSKLSIFDFDGTLFKSPDKPKNYKGNWWANQESLNEPTIPERPGNEFWNLDVVSSAKKELTNPDIFCIMLTGRIDQFFQERIETLLKQKNLNFRLVGLNEFGRDTAEFKIEKIKEILSKHPTIKKIEMWEDEPEKISIYKTEFKNYDIKINQIKTDMMEKIFENWRRFLKEMYYYDPEYPDTNIAKMTNSGISFDGFDFYFEKSDQKEKAFSPTTKYFIANINDGILVFHKGEYEPFVDFEGKFKNLEDAKQVLPLTDVNSLVIKTNIDIKGT